MEHGNFILSTFGDLVLFAAFAGWTVVATIYGWRHNHPWLTAQVIPLGIITTYYLAAIFDLHRFWMSSGILRAAYFGLGVLNIVHIFRVDPKQIYRRVVGAFRR